VIDEDKQANKGAAPNAGGRPQFTIRTPLTARVGELDRSLPRFAREGMRR
jgi:hypothetical protein